MGPSTPEELAQAFAEAINSGDGERAASLWTDDALVIGPDGSTVRGREGITDMLMQLTRAGTHVEIDLRHLHVAGDVALAGGALTLINGEQRTRAPASSTVVYRRSEDGTWRVALDAPWGLPGGAS